MKIESTLSKIFLLFLSLCFAFALLEAASRMYLHFAPEPVFRKYGSLNQLYSRYGKNNLQQTYSPHRYLGFYPTPNFQKGLDKHNSLGFRGDEIELKKKDGVFRIACLGGSTTYGMTEDYREAYPYQLERYLHENGYPQVEVINAGAGMYTSWETLINFQFRLLELEPDLIIVYHAINDVYPRIVWPPSAYRADNSGARIVNVSPMKMPPIWHYSTFLRMFAVRAGLAESHGSLDWNLVERPPSFYAGLHRMLYRQNRYPADIFLKVPASKMLEENRPIYFESNLKSLIAIAQANDVKVVFVTFAYSPFFDDPAISCRENQKAIEEHNEIVRGFSDRAYVHDFAKAMSVNKEYYQDGYHFTPAGEIKRAQLIGDYLAENNLLD
ncbi:MAG: SGNH/GDSL hydrolase family protein [Candidatus Abyssobacteria bacterium SURF_5]|uniref:SGNH/GDSL hydrolase family protein n=1 Tax=Abyssobacteria bacterium (strain SURF_5) TaxID=2093360 RepID=A0A3A4NUB4_ABYX5|nr:MAG: SGNH/GDSL hydrolase family protein [Candidatus Abyssubacteria bacterium SURF_5]